MRIAVDLTPVRPDGSAGGATGVAIELLKALVKQQDIKLILLCADWNIENLQKVFADQVEYKEVITGSNAKKSEAFVAKVLRKLGISCQGKTNTIEYQADLLFCPFSAVNYKQEGVPVVSTIHDIQHEFYPQFFTPEELQHRRNFYKNIVENAERAICVSDYTRKTFCECYGYNEEKATTVYNAIQERFVNEDRKVLQKLDIEQNQYIVFPANFWEHKNHKLLLNAFGMYGMQNPTGKLVLTGNALGQEEYYNQVIEAMNLKGRVVITGYLSEEELYAVLNNAKGLIYPSLFEGFGIPLVEAMQMKKLVASSNLTSLPEVGCDSIYYFNPKKPDEIVKGIEFLFQSQMNDEIEKDYKLQLEKYTTETMMQQYLEVFKEAIATGAEYKRSVRVDGVYGDGWTQRQVNFHIVKHEGDALKLAFRIPVHLNKRTKVYIKNGDKKVSYQYMPDERIEVAEIIKDDCVDVQLIVSSTWNPDKIMHSGDCRELGVMMENMEPVTRDGVEKINII